MNKRTASNKETQEKVCLLLAQLGDMIMYWFSGMAGSHGNEFAFRKQ